MKSQYDKAIEAEQARIYEMPLDAQSFVGLEGIWVEIIDLCEDAKSTGLTEEMLKTDVELKLRLARITINSQEEFIASDDWAKLLVNIKSGSGDDSPDMGYSIRVELFQKVVLVRSPFISVMGPTWGSSCLGVCSKCSKSDFPEIARKGVKDLVDMFLKNYLSANPTE